MRRHVVNRLLIRGERGLDQPDTGACMRAWGNVAQTSGLAPMYTIYVINVENAKRGRRDWA